MPMINILDVCDSNSIRKLFSFGGQIYNIIKIAIPIIIIVLGTIDLIKILISENEETKKHQKLFIKRLIFGICIFFVFPLISYIINLLGENTNNSCMLCFTNPTNIKVCNYNNSKTKIEIIENVKLECSDSNNKNACCKNTFGENDSTEIWSWNDNVGCVNKIIK